MLSLGSSGGIVGWREKRGIAPRKMFIRNLALHEMWVEDLGSLNPSFLICKMKLARPTSCGSGEI